MSVLLIKRLTVAESSTRATTISPFCRSGTLLHNQLVAGQDSGANHLSPLTFSMNVSELGRISAGNGK